MCEDLKSLDTFKASCLTDEYILYAYIVIYPLPELDNVEGISVDWIGNNLYWTNDGYRKTISIARLDRASQTRKTLLEGNMSHPRAIVVDPPNRSAKGKNYLDSQRGKKSYLATHTS